MKLSTVSLVLFILFFDAVSVLAKSDNIDQKLTFSKRLASNEEISYLKAKIGVAQEGVNYNVIINGFGTGLKPPSEAQWAKMKEQVFIVDKIKFRDASVPTPTSHDNSATKWFPPIGSQGNKGSCVAWAAAYYNKTFQEAKEHDWDLSACVWEWEYDEVGGSWIGYPSDGYRNKIFSPDFVYHQINDGIDQGAYYDDAIDLLYRIGCCTWDKMPYDVFNYTSWPSEEAWRQAPIYRSATDYHSNIVYGKIDAKNDDDIDNLKIFISNGNNAIIAIDAYYYNVLTSNDLWTSDVYVASGSGHANLIVGYDDNFGPYAEEGEEKYGAFKVANSWGVGSSWENDFDNEEDAGFYWISYECMKQRVEYYMCYENEEAYEPKVISVFSLEHDLRGDCEVTVGVGNPSSPSATKRFDDYFGRGGAYAYPANEMVMDITELENVANAESFYIQVYDRATSSVGKINNFSIEMYDDYSSGIPSVVYESTETPKNTLSGTSVFAGIEIPIPDIVLSSDELDFGSLKCDSMATDTLIIYNRGLEQLIISSIDTYNNYFAVSLSGVSIPPNDSLIVTLSITPSEVREYIDTLEIVSDDPDTPLLHVQLTASSYRGKLYDLRSDSLALVAFYNATDGANWSFNENWLTGTVDTWFGVTVSNSRVSRLEFSENNLSGYIPNEIGELTDLDVLTLTMNSGLSNSSIPDSIGKLENVTVLCLSDNELSGNIPRSIGDMTNLQYLDLQNNKLTFANFESSGITPGSIETFIYAPQDTLLTMSVDGEMLTALDGNSSQNRFVWYRDGIQLSDTTRTIAVQEGGLYWFRLTNPVYSELTLYSDTLTIETSEVPINFEVAGLLINTGDSECYNAQNDITIAGNDNVVTVKIGASVNFIAGQSIRFLPGFYAENGSYVDAHITTKGSFCYDMSAPLMAAEPVVNRSLELGESDHEEDVFEKQSMMVYPNPNNGMFTIKLTNIDGDTKVLMYNSVGQKVYDGTITEQLHSIELPNIMRGIYFIKAVNKQKQFNQKIVIR